MPFSLWKTIPNAPRVALSANGTFWGWNTRPPGSTLGIGVPQFDLFGNVLRDNVTNTLADEDFVLAASPGNRLHALIVSGVDRLTTFDQNGRVIASNGIIDLFTPVAPFVPANPAIATATSTSGIVAFTNASYDATSGETPDTIWVRAFDASTGAFTAPLIQLGRGSEPELIALADGRYAVIARSGSPTLFFLDAGGSPVAFQTIGDRAAPRLAALTDGGWALAGRQSDSTVAVNVYTAQGVLEAVRTLGVATGDYSLAGLPGGGFIVSVGSSDTLIFYDNSGLELRREALPAGLGGHELSPFLDGRIAIDGAIYDPRTDFNGLTDYGGTTYQIGGGGDDFIIARADADEVHGGPGNDTIIDDPNSAGLIAGDEGDDTIIIDGYFEGPVSAERISGGPGNDTIAVIFPGLSTSMRLVADLRAQFINTDTGGIRLEGIENFSSSGSTDYIVSIVVYGNDSANIIQTGNGEDNLTGDGGDDVLDGGPGVDIMQGGTGNDIYIVDNALDIAFERPGEGFDTVRTSSANYVLRADVERLEYTGTAPARLTGNPGDNILVGGPANDVLVGGGGDDLLNGGQGADFFFGGTGNDIYIVDDQSDAVFEQPGEGLDTIRTSVANYVLPANVERLEYTGTAPTTLTGNAGDNVLVGGAANDRFNAQQGGNDTLNGGDGDDGFFFGGAFDANDDVDGGPGSNDQIGLQGNYAGGLILGANSTKNVEVLALLSGAGFGYNITTIDANVAAGQVLTIFGGNLPIGNDMVFDGRAETDGAFRVYGGQGVDTIRTGAGDDGIYFGPGRFGASDFVDAGAGDNDQVALDGNYTLTLTRAQLQNVEVLALLRGVAGDLASYNITLADDLIGAGRSLTVFGLNVATGFTFDASAETDGTIRVIGGSGADTITTGSGADRLFGGDGADRLNGGAGADTFVYDAVSQSTGANYDRITGFVSGVDKFDFGFKVTGVDATIVGGTLSTASFNGNLGAAIGAGQLAASHAVLFQPSGGDLGGRTFLVVDANGFAGYQADSDYVIELAPSSQLGLGDFAGQSALTIDVNGVGGILLGDDYGTHYAVSPISLAVEDFI